MLGFGTTHSAPVERARAGGPRGCSAAAGIVGAARVQSCAIALGRWIDATVRAEFEGLVPWFDVAIAGQLTELERRYAVRVSGVRRRCGQLAVLLDRCLDDSRSGFPVVRV